MDEDSPHRIGQPLVPDISWDAQMTLRVHGAKLECRGSWWRLVTQICILLVLRVHLANLPTAMLPLLDLFHQKRFTWKMGSMKKTWKRQKKHIVYGNKITKHPVLQKLVLHGSDAVLEDVAVLRLAEAGHIALWLQLCHHVHKHLCHWLKPLWTYKGKKINTLELSFF